MNCAAPIVGGILDGVEISSRHDADCNSERTESNPRPLFYAENQRVTKYRRVTP